MCSHICNLQTCEIFSCHICNLQTCQVKDSFLCSNRQFFMNRHEPPPLPKKILKSYDLWKFNNEAYAKKFESIAIQIIKCNADDEKFPECIAYFIASFATGLMESCISTVIPDFTNCLKHENKWMCNGKIYHTNENFKQYETITHDERGLKKYSCNNPICFDVFIILKCHEKDCETVFVYNYEEQQEEEEEEPYLICYNAVANNNVFCNNVFCNEHSKQSGLKCDRCHKYFCNQCCASNNNGIWIYKCLCTTMETKKKHIKSKWWFCKYCIGRRIIQKYLSTMPYCKVCNKCVLRIYFAPLFQVMYH